MARLPRLKGKDLLRFLARQGFTVACVRDSHHFLERGDVRTSVPIHGNRNVKIGTLRGILRDIGMTPTEFEELWSS